jgi:hypothetical protein
VLTFARCRAAATAVAPGSYPLPAARDLSVIQDRGRTARISLGAKRRPLKVETMTQDWRSRDWPGVVVKATETNLDIMRLLRATGSLTVALLDL